MCLVWLQENQNHACFYVISKDNSENELCVNQTDVNTCLEMHFQHVLNVWGSGTFKNCLSCLVTFVVNIVKYDSQCKEYWLNFILNFPNMIIKYSWTPLNIVCADNIVLTWLFAVFSIGVTSQDKGGYVMVLKFFSGFSTWNWPFSIIFLKYRYRLLGETKGNLLILIQGSNFACVKIKSTISFGKIEILVLS